MTAAERAFVARLTRRANTLAPELAARELRAFDLIRDSLTDAELAKAINAGQVDALIADLLSDKRLDPSLVQLRARLDRGLKEAAASEAKNLPSRLATVSFDTLSPHVLEAARELDVRVSSAIKDDVRATVRQTVTDGIEAGKNPRTVATRIQQYVGLSPQQARAVENFRTELETGDRAALDRVLGRGTIRTPNGDEINRASHAGGQGLTARQLGTLDAKLGAEALTPAQVERLTESYRRRLLAWNAESNARTMALDAQKIGQHASWEDAVERGVIERGQLFRTWLAVGGPGGDGRNREEHLAMHGETVGFDDTFSNGEFTPGDSTYNCRCQARIFAKAVA